MGAPGLQLHFHQRKPPVGLQHLILRDHSLGVRSRMVVDHCLVLRRILPVIVGQGRFLRLRYALDQTKVKLLDLPLPDGFVQDPEGLGVLGYDDDAPGVPVDPVAERRRKGRLF